MDDFFSTGNEAVDSLKKMNFTGNVIPAYWYKTIVRENGKPNLVAINILSDIVYWYRPSEKRDETTGSIIGYEMDRYIDLIKANIDYEDLIATENNPDLVDEIVSLLAETVTFNTQNIKIGGNNYPAEVVKSRFLKLNNADIEYVLTALSKNTSKVKNIKKYLLAVLYNCKLTNNNYYSAEVRHDMFGGDKGGSV